MAEADTSPAFDPSSIAPVSASVSNSTSLIAVAKIRETDRTHWISDVEHDRPEMILVVKEHGLKCVPPEEPGLKPGLLGDRVAGDNFSSDSSYGLTATSRKSKMRSFELNALQRQKLIRNGNFGDSDPNPPALQIHSTVIRGAARRAVYDGCRRRT